MTESRFIPNSYDDLPTSGKSSWRSPSNIALVKYWGKRENQIPANPSISFTLNSCFTTTLVSYEKLKEKQHQFSFDFLFEGSPKEEFKPKIQTFLSRIEVYLPFLKEYHLVIESSNSFPHSSGIASSASGMSALALCLMDMEKELNPTITPDFFNQKASFLARLGSGSACRSIQGPLVQWGSYKGIEESSDFYGVTYPFETHAVFQDFCDTVILVDKGEKTVSSSVGHGLMHHHPFAEQRFQQAHTNLDTLKAIFRSGDMDGFIQVVESEALTLHAMMMTSTPYFILMKPNTLQIINKIWAFRRETKSHVCFTLDAGANVHVLYPAAEKIVVLKFIKEELAPHCQNGQFIEDQVGTGAIKLV